ncbi:hypothetical protein A6V30_09115 [Wohlfahrtiimonas chitiniclastica]|nr:hypothetical protein A6V30_09115 [Wohlfahrtiimonas chitiniclastica]OYQ74841.1 hypothetical protein B9T18_06285 [Wohlfahrtiimonas chitiniclastica]
MKTNCLFYARKRGVTNKNTDHFNELPTFPQLHSDLLGGILTDWANGGKYGLHFDYIFNDQ